MQPRGAPTAVADAATVTEALRAWWAVTARQIRLSRLHGVAAVVVALRVHFLNPAAPACEVGEAQDARGDKIVWGAPSSIN
jgi:hypothetical protein